MMEEEIVIHLEMDRDCDSLGDGLGSESLDSPVMMHTKLKSLGWTTL